MLRPIPFVELAKQLALNIPASSHSEVGFNDIGNDSPGTHIIEPVCCLRHRTEVHINITECLLHALSNADTPDWDNGLSAENKLDIRF